MEYTEIRNILKDEYDKNRVDTNDNFLSRFAQAIFDAYASETKIFKTDDTSFAERYKAITGKEPNQYSKMVTEICSNAMIASLKNDFINMHSERNLKLASVGQKIIVIRELRPCNYKLCESFEVLDKHDYKGLKIRNKSGNLIWIPFKNKYGRWGFNNSHIFNICMDFKEVLVNNEDQVLVRQLLNAHIPIEIQLRITQLYNEQVIARKQIVRNNL